MNNREQSRPNMYQQLFQKINQVCEKKRKSRVENSMTSTPSPPIRDLWRGLHPHRTPSLTFQCPHCPHCNSPLHPHFPEIPPKTLLTSLKSCQTELQFINTIVWMKSMVTASPVVPIAHVKTILKALLEIEENTPPKLLSQGELAKEPSLIISSPGLSSPPPPTLSTIQELPVDLRQSEEPTKSPLLFVMTRSNSKTFCIKRSDSKILKKGGKKRKLQQDDSAVVLEDSPGRSWNLYAHDSSENYERTTLIPESDEEASQMTPDMSFGGSFDGNYPLPGWINDSGLYDGQDDDERDKIHQNILEIDQEVEEREEEMEVISSIKLAGILREFPIISAALSIVRSTLRALEAPDTVEYCWREGEVVSNAVKVILEFIDTVAIEEYKYPGYLDFFVKCSVETVRNVFEKLGDVDYVDVKRHHHLITILELCNCRVICEQVISYLFELLSKLTDDESSQENSPSIVSTQSKRCLILDTIYVTIEKYINIMGLNLVQSSLDFFHVKIENPAEKLLKSWSIHLNNFVRKNFHISPAKVSIIKSLFRSLKIELTEKKSD